MVELNCMSDVGPPLLLQALFRHVTATASLVASGPVLAMAVGREAVQRQLGPPPDPNRACVASSVVVVMTWHGRRLQAARARRWGTTG